MDMGWEGDPVGLPANKYLLRIGSNDTDSFKDWISTKPGLTNRSFNPELFFDASVVPFSFPESAGTPIFRELEKAKNEVLISIYILSNVQLVALLCDLSSNGVAVRILLEGDVLEYNMSSELTLMKSIVDSGGEVYLINDPAPGNYERFSYFHNKYAVIDGKKLIVTSENWTSDNLSSECSNRGWGAVMESEDLAEYAKSVFFSDMSLEYGDVRPLSYCYPGLKPYQGILTYSENTSCYETETFDARVMPIMSPDNSRSALNYFIDNAETRVYSQQMDLGSSFRVIAAPSPLESMSAAAERGADVRLILDTSSDGTEKNSVIDVINNTSGIKAIAVNGTESFSLIHNKGLIIDDTVWISSVNWTENSFMNNREFAVAIESAEVADFFTGLFVEDWGVNEHTIAETGLEVTHREVCAGSKTVQVFTVSGPERSTYIWDILGDGNLRTTDINMIVCSDIPEGEYTMSVTMDGTSYSADYDYSVVSGKEHSAGKDWYWEVASGISAIAAGGFIIRRRILTAER
jgi:phosphatidylserine/phosphatidylglycerophosphate/cardiolipin synthase-like enzyme